MKALLLSLASLAYLVPQAMAQAPQMPADCIAIAAQIQTEIHVRFVHTKGSPSTLVTDPDLNSESGAQSITMQCPPWASGLNPLPYSYVVTIWAEGSNPSTEFYELTGRTGSILTTEKPSMLNEASRHCFQKALKSEFRFSAVLTPKATVRCQYDPDVRPPNISIWRRSASDVED